MEQGIEYVAVYDMNKKEYVALECHAQFILKIEIKRNANEYCIIFMYIIHIMVHTSKITCQTCKTIKFDRNRWIP